MKKEEKKDFNHFWKTNIMLLILSGADKEKLQRKIENLFFEYALYKKEQNKELYEKKGFLDDHMGEKSEPYKNFLQLMEKTIEENQEKVDYFLDYKKKIKSISFPFIAVCFFFLIQVIFSYILKKTGYLTKYHNGLRRKNFSYLWLFMEKKWRKN